MDSRRKQIYLEPEQEEDLSKLALVTGKSESAIIREALAEYLAKIHKEVEATDNPLAEFLKMEVRSTTGDGSEHHDRYLYGEAKSKSGAPAEQGYQKSPSGTTTRRKKELGAGGEP